MPTPTDPAYGMAITIETLTKSYPLPGGDSLLAIDHISTAIAAGSAVALTGPSGSGKSTLLHLLGAIDRPDSGTIRADDTAVERLSRRERTRYRQRVGFIFQRYNLLPALTARNNVLAPVLPYRTTYDKRRRADQLLTDVGLDGRQDALPSRLSGGQQQRVAIARALINNPALILADEPTGNLDSHTGAQILDLLLQLRDQHKITVVLATHDPQAAARCDRLVRLRDGAIVDDISPGTGQSAKATFDRINQLRP